MHLVQADDSGAFEKLFERHWPRVFGVTRTICRNRAQAEEAAQDAFLAIWRTRATYDAARGSFKGWSAGIARNRAIDSARKAASRERAQTRHGESERVTRRTGRADPEVAVQDREDQSALWASLKDLPETQAEVIALAFYGNLTHAEIASRLALPPGTIKGRMRLGLEKMRLAIQDAEPGASAGGGPPRK